MTTLIVEMKPLYSPKTKPPGYELSRTDILVFSWKRKASGWHRKAAIQRRKLYHPPADDQPKGNLAMHYAGEKLTTYAETTWKHCANRLQDTDEQLEAMTPATLNIDGCEDGDVIAHSILKHRVIRHHWLIRQAHSYRRAAWLANEENPKVRERVQNNTLYGLSPLELTEILPPTVLQMIEQRLDDFSTRMDQVDHDGERPTKTPMPDMTELRAQLYILLQREDRYLPLDSIGDLDSADLLHVNDADLLIAIIGPMTPLIEGKKSPEDSVTFSVYELRGNFLREYSTTRAEITQRLADSTRFEHGLGHGTSLLSAPPIAPAP